MMKAWKNIPLYMKIFILLIAGCVIGFVFGENVAVLAPVGLSLIHISPSTDRIRPVKMGTMMASREGFTISRRAPLVQRPTQEA